MGGLVATLLAERSPGLVDGVLSICAPAGDLQSEINYLADVRVLFDYFFPGFIPGSAVDTPQFVVDQWDTRYKPAVISALTKHPDELIQLVLSSGLPFDPSNGQVTAIEGAVIVLWFGVMSGNDMRARLGGNPYDNTDRKYERSADDARLNATLPRFRADPTGERSEEHTSELQSLAY